MSKYQGRNTSITNDQDEPQLDDTNDTSMNLL